MRSTEGDSSSVCEQPHAIVITMRRAVGFGRIIVEGDGRRKEDADELATGAIFQKVQRRESQERMIGMADRVKGSRALGRAKRCS